MIAPMGGCDERPLWDTTRLCCTEPDPRSGRTAHDTLHLVHKIKRYWRSTITDNFVERLKKTEDN